MSSGSTVLQEHFTWETQVKLFSVQAGPLRGKFTLDIFNEFVKSSKFFYYTLRKTLADNQESAK
jgi:hypothetical protein